MSMKLNWKIILRNKTFQLAEGPLWDSRLNNYFFLDIYGFCLYQITEEYEIKESFTFKKHPTCIGLTDDPNIVVLFLKNEVVLFNLKTKNIRSLYHFNFSETIRTNDGKCDIEGKFWIGTMSDPPKKNMGNLFCLYKNNNQYLCKKILDNVTISNGLTWDYSSNYLYYIDTPKQKIIRYTIQRQFELRNPKIIYSFENTKSYPDGMTIDSEGNLWVALWGNGSIINVQPETGFVLNQVHLPAKWISSCFFGGKDQNKLLVTSAYPNDERNKKENNLFKHNGKCFIIDTNIKGEKVNYFRY